MPQARKPDVNLPELASLSDRHLVQYAQALGIHKPAVDRKRLEAQVGARLELIRSIDRGELLDLAAWTGVDPDADSFTLTANILARPGARFEDLSLRALQALAALHDVPEARRLDRNELLRQLRRSLGLWRRIRRHRRRLVGSILESAFGAEVSKETAPPHAPLSLREQVESRGVVGGISASIYGAADDYIAAKLDEIDERIDRKLDAIDQRLSDWRDREIAHRLRLIKVTLIATIIVAALSLGYDYFLRGVAPANATPTPSAAKTRAVERTDAPIGD